MGGHFGGAGRRAPVVGNGKGLVEVAFQPEGWEGAGGGTVQDMAIRDMCNMY